MRQVWIAKAGGPEVLEVRESPDPTVAPGTVQIRVAATGINFADIMARMGLYPDAPPIPCVVGYEVAGTVENVGDGVTDFRPGERVLSFTRFGGYSDVVNVPREWVLRLPADMPFEKAAAIPVNYITAWLMLIRQGNLKPGETVLVHAAAGGVGQAALQICKWRGATVIGTASPSKHARLTELGVAHCIDYTTRDFEAEVKKITQGRGVDIVLDAVGGSSFGKSYRSLAPLGRLFMFGASSFSKGKTRNYFDILKGAVSLPWFHPMPLMNNNRGVFGTNLGHLWDQLDTLQPDAREILRLVSEGIFNPVVDRTFTFDQAGEAQTYMQDRRNFGKVLLIP